LAVTASRTRTAGLRHRDRGIGIATTEMES
jgi:hypothetical protein